MVGSWARRVGERSMTRHLTPGFLDGKMDAIVPTSERGCGDEKWTWCPSTECHCVPTASLPPRARAADAAFRGPTSDPLSSVKWKFVAGSVSETGRIWAAPSEKSRAAPKAKQ